LRTARIPTNVTAGGGSLGIDFLNATEIARRGGALGILFGPNAVLWAEWTQNLDGMTRDP
jgi:hypothetical protein